VAQHERPLAVWLVRAFHCPFGRRVAGAPIVVAAHDEELTSSVAAPPGRHLGDHLGGHPLRRVKQVAQKDHLPRADPRDGLREPAEVVGQVALRHGQPGGAEGRCLADVQVGDEQGALPRPEHRPLWQKAHHLTCDGDLHVPKHVMLNTKYGIRNTKYALRNAYSVLRSA
jgi:hypothetical protein